MSYPRNAISPPRIAVGAVVQISDGVVQSSGVSIAVRPEGGSESSGSGTVSYGTLSNIVYYTPIQAETNYTAFAVVAYKSGCIPVGQTVPTSASPTAGYMGVDWNKVTNPTTAVELTSTTFKGYDIYGVVGSGSTTTSIVTSSLTPSVSVADQFKGRVVIFDADTTSASLRGQATDITANTNSGVLTVTALTNTPAYGDVFVVV